MGFNPGMQGFFNIRKLISVIHHINKVKNKPYDYLNRCREAFDKIQHPFNIKILQRVGIEGTSVQFSSDAQSCLTLCNPIDLAYEASPSMGFSRQEYWNELPFPSLGDLPNPGTDPKSPTL